MKKIFFATLTTLFAFAVFISCESKFSDSELTNEIIQFRVYDAADFNGDPMFFQFINVDSLPYKYIGAYNQIDPEEFDIKFKEYEQAQTLPPSEDEDEETPSIDASFAGSWTVKKGVLYLYDLDGNTYRGEIEKDGKRIVLLHDRGGVLVTLTHL